MAKKRKQKPGGKPKDRYTLTDTPNYDDPKQLEAEVRKAFQYSLDNVHRMEKNHPDILIQMDLDSARAKRRGKAVCAYANRVREMVKGFCPDMPDMFTIASEWAHINAMPITTYDHQEGSMYLILGAAIWMLDHIKRNGKIREAINLLPKDNGLLDDVSIPTLYDPVHREEVILSMVYALEQRNMDCVIQGATRAKKKANKPDPVDRCFMDTATVLQCQHQEVPSRQRFEQLLRLIPQQDIDTATAHYEEKLFEWVSCYFRCRVTYCRQEQELEERRNRLEMTALKRFNAITGAAEKPKTVPQLVAKPSLSLLSQNAGQRNSLEQMMSDPLQLLEYLDEESRKLDMEERDLLEKTNILAFRSHRLTNASYDRLKRDYGKEIADVMIGFVPGDPYEMCFALLYLLDRDSDLPWLYYPGTVISEYAGSMLPWYTVEYDELDDDHWAQYYDPEPRPKPGAVKNPPELADWYRLDYMNRTSDLNFQQRTNLAQIVYEFTGGIMPRDLHRYDDALKHMRHYGVTGKKVQIPLLYSMLLLGEGMHQSQDWRLEYNFPDDVFASLIDSTKAETEAETETEPKQDNNPYESELAALKEENARLKRIAYEADRESRDLRKQHDALLVKSQSEHQELSELREILFNQENELEAGLEEDAEDIVLPYRVNRTTVIFGGHDTWAKAIKPMLTGDIRFVDRNMRPDADLIRHADVIWLQPNSICHAFYYKIINIIRTYKIPLHYFKFASAEKCAKQLAAEDQKQI